MGPILGGMKQCKCMVILRDVPLIVHEVWVGNIMTPCVFRFIRTWKSPGFVCFFEERTVFLGSGKNLGEKGDTVDGSEILLTS